LAVEGSSDRQVAAQLFFSPNIVEYHPQKVFGNVGVSSRTRAGDPGSQREGAEMTSTPQPAHLNNHHRNTLREIFQHPAGHNIEWRAVVALLAAVGSVTEHRDGKVAVTIGSETEYFDIPAHKDIDTQMIVLDDRRSTSDARGRRIRTAPRRYLTARGPPDRSCSAAVAGDVGRHVRHGCAARCHRVIDTGVAGWHRVGL
jgi:hypothetical protein